MYKIKINRKKHTFKVQHVTRRVIVRGKAKRGLPGVGIPTGGTTGQILAKKSNANYDTEWRAEQAALVTSVNGKIGAVVLNKVDIGLPNVDNTSDANKPISTATQTALNAKEPTLAPGTTAQYLRGDKTWQTLNKAAVGLSNVDNTSDANKPISTATQTALNLKANDSAVVHKTGNETINGIKTFVDSPVVPTPTNPTDAANKQYVDDAISGIPDELVFNVKDYGAIGNGVADDTGAIQDAIDAAGTAGGGIVFMPAGTYKVNQSIGIQMTASGVYLLGAGMYSTTLRLTAGINVLQNLVRAESVGGLHFSDFSIDGNKATLSTDKEEATNYGLYLANSPESRVERVRVYNMAGVGIHVYNSRAVVVKGCITSDNDYHGYELEQTLDCVLEANDGHGNLRHGVFVSPGEVGGTGAIGNVITNNMFYDNQQYGIAFGIDAAGVSIGLTRDNIVSNNTIRGNTDYGISIYRVNSVSITGNLIEKNGKIGIYLFRSCRNIISNNRLIHNSHQNDGLYDEILLEGGNDGDGSFHNMIVDNWIETGAENGEPNANWAIREASANDGSNVIKNNYIPWSGASGKVQILNANTTFELVGDSTENEVSIRSFKQGIVISPDATLPGGVMGFDAPFGDAAFRMFSDVGNLQFVAPNGNADWYLGGNNVFSVTDSYATVHNYQLKEVATPTDGTDAANKNYVDSAVTGVPIGNYVLKSGDTMSGNLSMGGTFRVRSLADPALAQDAATKNYVDVTIAALVDSAPGTLDTLNELAAALGDDPNFATTMTTLIGTKANDADVLHKTGNETATGTKTIANIVINGSTGDPFIINATGSANSLMRFQDDGVERGSLFTLNGGATFTLRSQAALALSWDNGTSLKTITASGTTLTLPDPLNLSLGTTTGTKIGTATNQKLGFYNATPVIQPVLATDFTYTVSNGTTDRAFDADSLTMDEIADVLGTVSGDLVAVKTVLKSLGLLA